MSVLETQLASLKLSVQRGEFMIKFTKDQIVEKYKNCEIKNMAELGRSMGLSATYIRKVLLRAKVLPSSERAAREIFEGENVGILTILKPSFKNSLTKAWDCECNCGKRLVIEEEKLKKCRIRSCGCKFHKEALIGKVFNWLTIIGFSENNPKKCFVKCRCGNVVERYTNNVLKKYSTSCGCLLKTFSKDNPLFTGHEEISGVYWNTVKKSAKERNLAVNITIEQAWELFLKQGRRCALTGIPIRFAACKNERGNASLDRIDSNKPYNLDNVQWVDKHINKMKWEFSEEKLRKYCRLILDNYNNKLEDYII